MRTLKYDVVVIGGGPAGLAAALKAREKVEKVAVLERNDELGGILNQCIHSGFGLHVFKEELTGPEYAQRYVDMVAETDISCYLNTMVLDVTEDKHVVAMSEDGMLVFEAGSVVLAMGCRERTRGQIRIPGTRPAGVFTAGLAQRYVNLENFKPGSRVVILGSGDIGLIMARRLTLEGIKVVGVYELMPYANGLYRNIKNCLDDFGIPLHLSTTVTKIVGSKRVQAVEVSAVDENLKPIPGTEEEYSCDTLLLSVGLIPENEISRGMGVDMNPVTSGPKVNESLETNIEGVFACGNVLHVHDLVDFVSEEAGTAGRNAAEYVKLGEERRQDGKEIRMNPIEGVRYTVPGTINVDRMDENLTVRFRVGGVYKNCYISAYFDDERVIHRKRPVVAPGEMEEIKLTKEQLLKYPDLQTITVKIEEA